METGTRVKICGVTSEVDARAAVEAGADALGFMFYRGSSRHVELEAAARIARVVPGGIWKVGVFVDAAAEEVRRLMEVVGLDTVQFHGQETPAYCEGFEGVRVWKAFRVRDRASLEVLPEYAGADGWVLDSHVPGQLGGTGAVFNWDLAVEAKGLGRPVILAGGLTPGNAGKAVRQVRPAFVDVSSGVESSPGRKDPERMRAFVAAVRAAEGEPGIGGSNRSACR